MFTPEQLTAIETKVNEALSKQSLTPAQSEEIAHKIGDVISNMFKNEVFMNSFAHNLLRTLLSSVDFKINQSTMRVPKIVMIDNYIPGSNKIVLRAKPETGENYVTVYKDNTDVELEFPEDTLVNLLNLCYGYNLMVDELKYITTDTEFDRFRESMASEIYK